MDRKIFADIADGLGRGESAELTVRVDDTEYTRRFVRSDRLILLGGGHVSLDVCRLALFLGFDVVVADDRHMFANSERFPEAQVICDSFENAIDRIGITDKDYVCVLTRGHKWDRECIEKIISGTMPYYLGMISSRRRAEGLKDILLEKGYDKDRVAAVHAPIGLDIGAATTAEIALSICSEMIHEKRRERRRPADNELLQTDVNLDALRYLAYSDEPRAFLMVLRSTGSTPVKSGSMMAADILGNGRGTIGGGCSEAAAVNKARRLIGSGKSAVITFDMTDEVAADSGMVCGGEMTVYIADVSSSNS